MPRLPNDLYGLGAFIAEHYRFNCQTHPRLPFDPVSEMTRSEAVVQHCLIHLLKSSTGPIAAALEQYDHGVEFEPEMIRPALGKALVNIIKIAQEMGINADELCRLAASQVHVQANED